MKKTQNRHLHSGCGESLRSNLLDEVQGSAKEINNKGISKVSNSSAGQGRSAGILSGKEKNSNE
ncbi:MAG: hypothetical protein KAS48_03895 [Gammaproteobacteria bacterium]|nr:hypothetical protein [Gammaproteobacteria bacterium]MCK5091209.1 hypothetical protein [Gammaproteobacteria bacterium]